MKLDRPSGRRSWKSTGNVGQKVVPFPFINVSSTREAPRRRPRVHTRGRARQSLDTRRTACVRLPVSRAGSLRGRRLVRRTGPLRKRSTAEHSSFMSEDLRAALAASERRTAPRRRRRVARRERDEAVESAARLREALRTFAEDADEDEPPRDEGDERIEIYESAEDVSEDETSVGPTRWQRLAAALDAARRARRDADAAARAPRKSRLCAPQISRSRTQTCADESRARTRRPRWRGSRWRRPPRRCGGDWKRRRTKTPRRSRRRRRWKPRSRGWRRRSARASANWTRRAPRSRRWCARRAEREEALDGKRENVIRRANTAAAALAEARTLASRNRADRPGSRARAFTSTKSHG